MTTITISSNDFNKLIVSNLVTTVELKTVSGGESLTGGKGVKTPRSININGVTFVENI